MLSHIVKMLKYFIFFLTIQSGMVIESCSKSIIRRLPGYSGDLPFKLETGYVGVGEKEDVQLFYYFVESTRNPKEDPLIFHIAGGPGASGLGTFLFQLGPLNFNSYGDLDNLTLTLNPNAWTQMANIIFMDIPVGTGFSYSETTEGWISSDTILATQVVDFIKKFTRDHPKFMRNPLYISGGSYTGLIVPIATLELYEGNERGNDATFNIQGYILTSPLTNKFKDFNSRLEYAHRTALISDYIYQSAIDNCHGNYVEKNSTNPACLYSLQSYEECTSHLNLEHILEPLDCAVNYPTPDCETNASKAISKWANTEVVQKALNIRQGKIGKWMRINYTLHYIQGKNDTSCYSYDIFSSFSYHKKLSSKNCRALILSGDQDLTFPYVGVEQWITSLDMKVEVPWKPFYVDGQVGGYETKFAQNNYLLTFAMVKGAGHVVQKYKPKQTLILAQEWFSSQTSSYFWKK